MSPRLWERRSTLDREKKKQVVEELREKFGRSRGIVLTDYKGMTVAELSELRNALRGSAIEYHVVKNTLARIASEGTPMAPAGGGFKGPVGIAIGYREAPVTVKSILEFAKKNQKLKVTGGVIEGGYYGAKDLQAVAELPPREVLLSMLAGTMQAPLGKLAQLMAATVVRLAHAMSALREKKGGD